MIWCISIILVAWISARAGASTSGQSWQDLRPRRRLLGRQRAVVKFWIRRAIFRSRLGYLPRGSQQTSRTVAPAPAVMSPISRRSIQTALGHMAQGDCVSFFKH